LAERIEIMREDLNDLLYGRFRRNPNPPRPPMRQRGQHGQTLQDAISTAVNDARSTRRISGINTDNLMVLELISDAMAATSLDRLLSICNLWIVEEIKIADTNKSKLVVQFEDADALAKFESERALYMSESEEQGALAPGQRRSLFDAIENIRKVKREDRIGRRLAKHLASGAALPTGLFTVDIDVWYNGETRSILEIEGQIRSTLGTAGSRLLGDLFVMQTMLLGRAQVNEYTLNALLDHDLIALVDFPMGSATQNYTELYSQSYTPIVQNDLDETAPLAAVIDSGVFSGNPLLSEIIVGEEDFDLTENTTSDLNGHGSGVAGITAYGDFADYSNENHVFKPLVRICNGKVMHNDIWGNPVFSPDKRPEQIVKDAIVFFHEQYHCRVFNLSLGDTDYIYDGGRQMTWAGMIDQLARDLDIVIVVSAGNNNAPDLPEFTDRDDLCQKIRNQLLNSVNRLIDPATSALAITVGSIARNATPFQATGITALAVGDSGMMSAFTRAGKGVNGAVKPEFVDYGGNFSVSQRTRGQSAWRDKDRDLMEPTLNYTNEKVFRGFSGTSFAAPHVTNYAARVERSLETQLEEAPSANLIRAILASAARLAPPLRSWAEEAIDASYTGQVSKKADNCLRLVGYGKIDEDVLFSDASDPKHVTLFAEDALPLRELHLYKIPIPIEFLNVRSNKCISIGFAYNPPVRISRKEYIANSLFVEVFRRTDIERLRSFIAKKGEDAEEEAEAIFETFRQQYGADFEPGSTTIQNSTLQQRIWEKGARGGKDLLWEENDPYIYVLITGKERFTHEFREVPQPYALAVTFTYEADQDIRLRQTIEANVRIRNRIEERARIRERVQNQV
jgi:hypothetical protein